MIEIVIGIVVLILVIVGVAQLKKKPVDIKDALKQASTWEKTLYEAFNNPEKLADLSKYGRTTAELANQGKSAIHGQIKILREKYDVAETQALDYADFLDMFPELIRTFGLAYNRLRRGDIDFPDFKRSMLKKKYHLKGSTGVDYELRHTGD